MVHCQRVLRERGPNTRVTRSAGMGVVCLSSVPSRAARSLPPPERAEGEARARDLGEVDTGKKAKSQAKRRAVGNHAGREARWLSSSWRVGAPLSLSWAAGKHEEARLKYVQAYAVLKFPGVLFNLARAEMTVGHDVEAYKLFRDFLKMPQTDLDRSMLARKYYGELAKKVSLVTVTSQTPKGTKVIIDGVDAGETPLAEPIVVAAGTHDIVLRYADKEKKSPVSCPLSQTVTVELEVKEDPKVPIAPPGEKAVYPSWVPTIVLGGVGVAGIAVGSVLGALSSSQNDELKSLSATNPCRAGSGVACAELEDKASSASGLGTGSVIGYVGGGVFLGAAIVTAVVMKPWQARVKETKVQLVPGLGGGALVGTF
jgi:hypothetical protein